MKKYLLLSIFLFTCFGAFSDVINSESADILKEIELKGDLAPSRQRSLIKPIQAFINGTSIQADFLYSLGTIVISIYDEYNEVVYQQSVSTFAGQQVYINTTTLSSGEYTIEFVDSQNKYLDGVFEIEN